MDLAAFAATCCAGHFTEAQAAKRYRSGSPSTTRPVRDQTHHLCAYDSCDGPAFPGTVLTVGTGDFHQTSATAHGIKVTAVARFPRRLPWEGGSRRRNIALECKRGSQRQGRKLSAHFSPLGAKPAWGFGHLRDGAGRMADHRCSASPDKRTKGAFLSRPNGSLARTNCLAAGGPKGAFRHASRIETGFMTTIHWPIPENQPTGSTPCNNDSYRGPRAAGGFVG